MDAIAITFPTIVEVLPSVAELPTIQNTLHGCAPLISTTELEDAVIRVDSAKKMKIAFGSFWPSKVSTPVIPSVPFAVS